jgi:uncharacterized membrane protein (DUF373 family)
LLKKPTRNNRRFKEEALAVFSEDEFKLGATAIRVAERGIYLAVAALLALAALVTLIEAIVLLFAAIVGDGGSSPIFNVIDRLLFVLMLVELLHSVGASIQEGGIVAEPFFVVAIIACIRRILVITLGTSQMTKPGAWTPDNASLFRASMIELGLLGVLLLVLVGAIYAMRRMDRPFQPKSKAMQHEPAKVEV